MFLEVVYLKYSGNNLKEIVFPLGGIGTGSIGIAGNGCLVDWEIFNRPNKGSINRFTFFAVKAELPDGKSITKILNGDITKDLMGRSPYHNNDGYGFGVNSAMMCGFPHFEEVEFNGEFPIAELKFTDKNFPATVILKAFNPFIPLDADNSGIPAAFFDIEIKSNIDNVKYSVVLSVSSPFENSKNIVIDSEKYTAIKLIDDSKSDNEIGYGDMTVLVDCTDGICQDYCYRSGWERDNITTFWYEFTNGILKNRNYDVAGIYDICTVGKSETIDNNSSENFRFLLSWNFPNNYNYWSPLKDENDKDVIWKNYYATIFSDSVASAVYAADNWDFLYFETEKFRESLHSCSLDKAVIDAVSSTLSVLKTPTVLRLEDGSFYGWEGLDEKNGSCEGTCTHVWSYAYALCFLFPELERTLRNTEIKYNTDENGKMQFRTQLPLGRERTTWHACVDGQMATIFKIYRDWKITGNTDWLKENWEEIKRILEFVWSQKNDHKWDRDKDGVLEGRQHHTLDKELFGPSSWLQGMYLAALKAAAEMAEFLGDTDKKNEYNKLFESGYEWTKNNLFNGKYFYHKIDLENRDIIEEFDCPDYWNEERNQIKYQIGEGSEIDQILGQWHANICGLGDIFDKEQRRIALMSMFNNNFKKSMRDVVNCWRIFALNDEGGAIMCDYPDGCRKPAIPIAYCEECMTGFEYAFAGLLISEGFIDEGLEVVRAIRDRYDGEKRNPFNEIECGSNYARAMASFALLPIFSRFEYDLPKKHIGFSPIISGDYKCLWSLGSGWGDFIKEKDVSKIVIKGGKLDIKTLTLGYIGEVKEIYADGVNIPFDRQDKLLLFDDITVTKELIIK